MIGDVKPVQVADMVFSWMKLGTFIFSNGCHALGFAVLLSNMKTSTLSWWVLLASRLSLGVNLSNIFVVHYMRGRLLLMPIEFHHIHVKRLELSFLLEAAEAKVMGYTMCVWFASVLVSVVVHCAVAPHPGGREASTACAILSSPGALFL